MIKFAIYGKGGIGKSTLSSNLSAAFVKKGLKVMQIGCDPKADSTSLLCPKEKITSVLDLVRSSKPFTLQDMVKESESGVFCVEAGGPVPGLGCAGRGIINALESLENKGAYDYYKPDVVIYDVLGDVVCGGFAVPLRNEYAEIIFIVSSGEFMSIYAANNILKGICNYDPDRVGGIIFNSRGDPEEENRIRKFSEAVGIPIVASFERSELFMTAEENGKTIVEMYPDSRIAENFRELAEEFDWKYNQIIKINCVIEFKTFLVKFIKRTIHIVCSFPVFAAGFYV
jgi:nitrogenase iron protein NifH